MRKELNKELLKQVLINSNVVNSKLKDIVRNKNFDFLSSYVEKGEVLATIVDKIDMHENNEESKKMLSIFQNISDDHILLVIITTLEKDLFSLYIEVSKNKVIYIADDSDI